MSDLDDRLREKQRGYRKKYYDKNKKAIHAKRRVDRSVNRPALTAAKRKWEEQNPEKVALQRVRKRLRDLERRRGVSLGWHYDITPSQYDEIAAAQGFVCAICKTHERTKRSDRLFVDHDHATGALRALLCHQCNAGLGYFKEKPELLTRAIAYLAAFASNTRVDEKWPVRVRRALDEIGS